MKTPASTRIDINKDRIYRTNDLEEFARIFFPHKNAHQKRAAFLAIFCTLKNSPAKKITSTDKIASEYGLSQSAVTKTRSKMVKIGLVARRQGFWQFSSVFARSLQNLNDKLESFKSPAETRDQFNKENMMIEIAKGADTHKLFCRWKDWSKIKGNKKNITTNVYQTSLTGWHS